MSVLGHPMHLSAIFGDMLGFERLRAVSRGVAAPMVKNHMDHPSKTSISRQNLSVWSKKFKNEEILEKQIENSYRLHESCDVIKFSKEFYLLF